MGLSVQKLSHPVRINLLLWRSVLEFFVQNSGRLR